MLISFAQTLKRKDVEVLFNYKKDDFKAINIIPQVTDIDKIFNIDLILTKYNQKSVLSRTEKKFHQFLCNL